MVGPDFSCYLGYHSSLSRKSNPFTDRSPKYKIKLKRVALKREAKSMDIGPNTLKRQEICLVLAVGSTTPQARYPLASLLAWLAHHQGRSPNIKWPLICPPLQRSSPHNFTGPRPTRCSPSSPKWYESDCNIIESSIIPYFAFGSILANKKKKKKKKTGNLLVDSVQLTEWMNVWDGTF